ncbi:MAG TPA: HupE/UreJ family protein, partial [Steroidobacteraceae bacterium]|nr:HupE/UreJ family protein [Steroidobacteraceae bacterium]
MKRLLPAFLLCLVAMFCSPLPAFAHAASTSYMILNLPQGDGPVAVRWDLSLHAIVWTVFVDADYDGNVTWQEVQNAKPALGTAVLAQLTVQRGSAPCALAVKDFALASRAEENFLSVAMEADCPQRGWLVVRGSLFMSGDASQRVLLSAVRGEEQITGVIAATDPQWSEPVQASAWRSFARFIGEGVWHVLIGYDHIAFVLLLLLPAVMRPVDGKWQGATGLAQVAGEIVTIVTAFTIAHSITLALAVTGTVQLPVQPIEIAIAASIAVAGAVNLIPRLSRLRLPLAFGFGLVHGFGFANALGEIDAAGSSLLPLLAG